jgi:N-acetylglucosamine-6-sulfatase
MRHRNSRTLALAALAVIGFVVVAGGCSDDDFDQSNAEPAELTRRVAQGPNFVVVMTDDQDQASLAVMPHVQRELVDRGVNFTDFFSTYPECCPSRATFLTGQFAHNHGVLSNEPPDGGFGVLDDGDTLPVWLQQAGYEAAYMGKYLNGYGWEALGNSPTYIPPGWTAWEAFANHTEYQMYGYDLNVNGEIRAYGDRPEDYQTDVLATEASRFIHTHAGRRPFFLTVAPLAPHDEGVLEDKPNVARNPRPSPRDTGRFAGRELPRPPSFNRRDLAGMPRFVARLGRLGRREIASTTKLYRSRLESLLAVDDMVDRLLRSLKRSDELRDTIFIYTSDNGFLLGEHRMLGKDVIYEEAAKVPLVIRGHGFPQGAERSQVTGNVDLAPTIAELAGVKPGATVDGTSLLPVARNPNAGRHRSLLLEVLAQHEVTAVRSPRYLFGEYESGAAMLYDLKRDPYEIRNLARDPEYSTTRRRLARELERLRACSGRPCTR